MATINTLWIREDLNSGVRSTFLTCVDAQAASRLSISIPGKGERFIGSLFRTEAASEIIGNDSVQSEEMAGFFRVSGMRNQVVIELRADGQRRVNKVLQ